MTDGDTIMPEHLDPEFRGLQPIEPAIAQDIVPLEQAEQRYLQWALAQHGGDRQALADKLGVSERTLYRKLSR